MATGNRTTDAPAAQSRVGPRSKPARSELSREHIAQAALALVDREGAEALTMRRLAAELGVDPGRDLDCLCAMADTTWSFRVRIAPKRDADGRYRAVVTPLRREDPRPGAVDPLDLWVLRHGARPICVDGPDHGACLGDVVAHLLKAVDGLLGPPVAPLIASY